MRKITYNIDVLSKVEYIPMKESETFRVYEKLITKKHFFKPNEQYKVYYVNYDDSYYLKHKYLNKTELLNDIIKYFNDEFILINNIIYKKPKLILYHGDKIIDSFYYNSNEEADKNYKDIKSRINNPTSYEK